MPQRKPIVVSNAPGPDDQFVPFAQKIATGLTNNAKFGNPPVSSAALTVLIEDMVPLVGKKGPGVATLRKEKRQKVEAALKLNEAYVESVVVTLPPDEIAAAIQSTGYSEKKIAARTKQKFSVKRGKVEGSIVATVKAVGRHGSVQYCHAYSLDGGKTWVELPPIIDTSITIPGLPLATSASFRFRTLVKGAYGDWSQTLSLLIH